MALKSTRLPQVVGSCLVLAAFTMALVIADAPVIAQSTPCPDNGRWIERSHSIDGVPGRRSQCVLGNQAHGPIQVVSTAGTLLLQGQSDHSKRIGEWRHYYPNGQLREISNFANDLAHGSSLQWHENGSPKIEGSYQSGEKHGPWREWYENSSPKIEGSYQGG